jgi:23S rRNA (adenine2503-C2)-methyltransferase
MACLSSQVGCAMGCDFCASTIGGVERNLSHGEIVEQFVHLQAEARAVGRRVTSVVFMGMGEPLLNLDAVVPAIRILADPDLGSVGWRQVTVSTVGIVPGIERLAREDLNVHLAVSLHAADDATRASIVPMNRKYPIDAVLSAAARFAKATGRVVTIEWCLLAGVNDTDEQADRLGTLLRAHGLLRRAHVNVIPYNPIGLSVRGREYTRPTPLGLKRFLERLQLAGVVCHPRDTRGDDVSAACGQLRRARGQ